MEILNQLGSLIVGAVPTMILFVLVIFAYSVLVRRPLGRILEERHARTVGAMDQARGAIAAAEAETAVYESKVRAARQEILAERDRRLKERQAARERTLAGAREQAQGRIQAARTEIAASAETARRQLEASIDDLGQRIARVILPVGAGVGSGSEAGQ